MSTTVAECSGASGRVSSNFSGCCCPSGAVAFGIIALLPVELILQVGSSAGLAMIFALLIAAILWEPPAPGGWACRFPVVTHPDRLDHRRQRRQRLSARRRLVPAVSIGSAQATKIGYALHCCRLRWVSCRAALLLELNGRS